jgi:hypothetical protein
MTDGQFLIATWKKICEAVDCDDKKTAESRCIELGIKIVRINGVPHISKHQTERIIKKKFEIP